MSDERPDPQTIPNRWRIFQRQQEVSAEFRTALIRLAAVAIFYVIHLTSYLAADKTAEAYTRFHWNITLICIVWCMVSVAVLVCVYRKNLPLWTKYLTTGADILLLVSAAIINAGANSYEVIIFPVIVASTGLRFNRSLISYATAMSVSGYMILVGATDRVWFDNDHEVETVHLLITVTCIALAGVIAWQIVEQVRRAFVSEG